MAVSVQLAESTSKRWEFEVFLSFTGELDSVKNFASSLYAALWSKGITCLYDEKIKGESQRLKAIEDSRFAIVLLSQDFASSTRCLNELLKIVESRQEFGQQVFPIFYDVDPSDVINQRGSFAVHEKGFLEKEKVQRWRCALTEVGNLTGWNFKYWHETDLIENIASETLSNICSKLPSYHNNLVGIPSRMDELNSYLRIGLDDVRFVGIYGEGGIGKTTLARHIYERISSQFEICYFLGNVCKKASKNGQVHLQRKLLSSHINISSMQTFDTNEGKTLMRSCFYNKKVLLVLDNVNDISQLESLVESPEWFGAGSRVIITTRDMQLLKSHGVHGMYEMKSMNKDESLQLLSKKAFRKDHPEEGYLKLSKSVIQYARGLPLVLNVLGCFLCGRSIPEWEDILDKLEKIAKNSIHQTLKMCYDGLDREEQTLFLDIASFFKGWEKIKVVQVLKDSGLYSKIEIGLSLLIEKSFLIEKDNCLEIHDLLDELAMSIISQESSDNVEQRNRLWDLRDINQIFESHKEIIKQTIPSDSQSQTNNALNLPRDLRSLYRSLKAFLWKDIPSKDLQLETPFNEFVRVSMQYSNLKKLWNGIQWLEKLKVMDLSHSKKLIETPNFLGVPNLESVIFRGCTSLVKVHPSLGELKKLVLLNLRDCKSLKILPRKLEMDSLVVLLLCGCSKVTKLPEFGECMENLAFLDLQDTAIYNRTSKIPW